MKTTIKLLILSLLFVSMSCDQTKKVLNTAGEVQLTGTYEVKLLNNNKIDNKITLSFNPLNKQINGDAGCNTYFGSYDVEGFTLSLKGIGSTEKMCQPESVMKNEYDFLQALNNVGSYRLNNKTLVLYAKSNNAVLVSADKMEN